MKDSVDSKSKGKLKKRRYVSFKGKIRRGMFLNTFITVSLFAVTMLVVLSVMITLFGQFIAYSKGGEMAELISSERFLEFAQISELKQMIRPKFDRNFLRMVFEQTDAIVLMKPKEMAQSPVLADHASDYIPALPPDANLTVLQFRLKLGDNVVYTSPEFNQTSDFASLDTYTSTPFTSVTGETGVVESRVTPKLLEFAYIAIAILIIMIAGIAMLFSMLVAHFFSLKIIRPIRSLITKMNKIAEEDLIDVVQHEIHVNKPVQEIVELTDASNAIFLKMRDFAMLLEAQNQELLAQNDELEASSEQMAQLNDEINLFNLRLENILNNSGQGFLAFGESLKINDVYSKECEIIFGRRISGMEFAELIDGGSADGAFLNRIYRKILSGEEDADVYMELLPSEWAHNGLYYKIEHRIIATELNELGIMVILTNVTHKKQLEESMLIEQSNLHRVVKIVRYPQEFKSLYDDMKDYQDNQLKAFEQVADLSREAFYEIYRALHNFKGLLSQFDFQQSVMLINALEARCSAMLDVEHFISDDALELLKGLDLMEIIAEDLAVVDDYLGKSSYQHSSMIQVDESKLDILEEQLKATLNFETLAAVMPYLQQLRDRALKHLFRSFPEYADKLADRLEKEINPLQIIGEDIECDLTRYVPLSKAMIHLVRNAIDHGIETADERLEAGKSEKGNVCLSMKLEGSEIVLTFSDDGGGIDVDLIKAQLMQLKMATSEQLEDMSDNDALMHIFSERFSTKHEATDISGRGIGLSAVLHEVKALDGSIEVSTRLSQGTDFVLRLPYVDGDYSCSIHLEIFESEVIERSKAVFNMYTGKTFSSGAVGLDAKHTLYRYTALLNVKGIINAMIVISMPEELIAALGKGYLGSDDDLTQEENEDLVLEISNVIVGNSLEALGLVADQIKLGTPTLVCYNGASVKYSESDIRAFTMVSEEFTAHVSMLYY